MKCCKWSDLNTGLVACQSCSAYACHDVQVTMMNGTAYARAIAVELILSVKI